MPLEFACPSCGKPLSAPFAAAGLAGACKFCHARLVAPERPGMAAAAVQATPAAHEMAQAPPLIPSSAPVAAALAASGPVSFDKMVDPFSPTAGLKDITSVPYLDCGEIWDRVKAHVLDNVLLLIALWIILALLPALREFSPEAYHARIVTGNLIFCFMEWLYYSVMESSPAQATVGKMWQGLKVVDTNNERLSFAHAAGRSAAKFVSCYTLYVGYIMAMFNDRSQALHDVLAKTVVVVG